MFKLTNFGETGPTYEEIRAAGKGWFDVVMDALDALSRATADETLTTTLAGAWRIVAELGFAPAIDLCGECHDALPEDATVMFSHRAGGALCQRCGRLDQHQRDAQAHITGQRDFGVKMLVGNWHAWNDRKRQDPSPNGEGHVIRVVDGVALADFRGKFLDG